MCAVHHPEVLKRLLPQAKTPLHDAAAVNSTRWALQAALRSCGLPAATSSGGRTKWNRARLDIPKTYALDAACVGAVEFVHGSACQTLAIKATGRGSYQRASDRGRPCTRLSHRDQAYPRFPDRESGARRSTSRQEGGRPPRPGGGARSQGFYHSDGARRKASSMANPIVTAASCSGRTGMPVPQRKRALCAPPIPLRPERQGFARRNL
jgi:hypothetical protein